MLKTERERERERESERVGGGGGGGAYLFNNLCLVSTVSYYLVFINERNLHIRITVYERGMCVCTCTRVKSVLFEGRGAISSLTSVQRHPSLVDQ